VKGLILPVILTLSGFAAYVRFAPSDPDVWHKRIDLHGWSMDGIWENVVPMHGGASLRMAGDGQALLLDMAQIAAQWPQTQLLAGSVEEGRITWIKRSRFWGFPDYITADAREDGIYVYARSRFGNQDYGVNAAALSDWQGQMK
jgi:hypothetical protein